jgi:hypothetical protein
MKISFIGCYITPRAKIYVSSAHTAREKESSPLPPPLGIILMQRDGENTQRRRHTHTHTKGNPTFRSRPICTLNSSIFADEMMLRRIRKLQRRFRTMPVRVIRKVALVIMGAPSPINGRNLRSHSPKKSQSFAFSCYSFALYVITNKI